jgi:DNA modification methylase
MRPNRNSINTAIAERTRRRRETLAQAQAAESQRPVRNDLLPTLEVVLCPIGKLMAPAHDVRKHAAVHVQRLKASIGEFGVVRPLLIRGDGEIVDGVGLFLAAKSLGLSELPCIVVDHLTDSELRRLRLTLNRLQERGEWDLPALRAELSELRLAEEDLTVTGFEAPEIDALLLDDEPDGELDDTRLDPDAVPVTQPGDLWRLGAHVIACGDARDTGLYDSLVGRAPVRLVLTDPPYNVPIKGHVTSGQHAEFAMAAGEMSPAEFEAFLTACLKPCRDHLEAGGLLLSFMDWRGLHTLTASALGLGLELLNIIVWAKTNAGMGSLWRSQHELLPAFKKPGGAHLNNVELGRHGRWRSNLWTYPGASSLGSDARDGLGDHPTPKPVALLEDALLDVTYAGDLVLEPFAGSGSVLIACERTGRRCRAIEFEPTYVDLTVRRWQALTGQDALHEASGETFAEREAAAAGEPEPLVQEGRS